MATYFDTHSPDDLDLLPPEIQTNDDLDRVVDEVEAEIIGVFRIRDGDTFHVMLYGYESSDPSGVKTQFAAGMKKAIALVTEHRIRHAGVSDRIKSESQGRRSWTYQDGFDSRWPQGWQAPIAQFDLRSPAHAI